MRVNPETNESYIQIELNVTPSVFDYWKDSFSEDDGEVIVRLDRI